MLTADTGRRAGQGMRSRLTASSVRAAARWTPYVEAELLGLRSLVGAGSVCLDVGAAAGLYTLMLSQLAGREGRVHSVEPLPFAHPVWTRLLRARAAGNVRHHPVALSAEPGSSVMSVPLGRYGPVTGRSFVTDRSSGLGSNAEFAGHLAVDVPVETVDGLCASAGLSRLDFVKVDVEGAELLVLEGGRQAIESFRPALLVEIEARHTSRYGYSPADITGWLTQRGYTMHIWRRGWQAASQVCPHIRNYLFRPGPAPQDPPPGPGLSAAVAGETEDG